MRFVAFRKRLNIYEPIRGEPEVEIYSMEEVLSLRNYYIEMTEEYSRNYYSISPDIIHTKVTFYNIGRVHEIPTKIDKIMIKDFTRTGKKMDSVVVEYCNEDGKCETAEITIDRPQTIVLREGNPDIWRTSVCKLKLMEILPQEESIPVAPPRIVSPTV